MPLPAPEPRQLYHTRRITTQGFRRESGLWDIEGHLIDTKDYAYTEPHRGPMPAGRPVHEMWLRLTMGNDMVVQEVAACTDNAPYSLCFDVEPNFQSLVGLRVGAGWRKEVRRRLGGTKGCTHMVEMLDVLATVAFQTIGSGASRGDGEKASVWRASGNPPMYLDGCHAWNSEGSIVRDLLPEFYKGKDR